MIIDSDTIQFEIAEMYKLNLVFHILRHRSSSLLSNIQYFTYTNNIDIWIRRILDERGSSARGTSVGVRSTLPQMLSCILTTSMVRTKLTFVNTNTIDENQHTRPCVRRYR